MEKHEATFTVDSKRDAYAVEKMANRLYDTVREESRSVRDGTDDSTEMIAAFEAICDAAERRTPGTLTVTYETHDGTFEE